LIRDSRPKQLDLVIETGQDVGMISLDRSLADLVRRKEISIEKAEFYSLNPSEFKNLL
jgi:twitching motility protein PilT